MWTSPHRFFAVTKPVKIGQGSNQLVTGLNQSYVKILLFNTSNYSKEM